MYRTCKNNVNFEMSLYVIQMVVKTYFIFSGVLGHLPKELE